MPLEISSDLQNRDREGARALLCLKRGSEKIGGSFGRVVWGKPLGQTLFCARDENLFVLGALRRSAKRFSPGFSRFGLRAYPLVD